MAKPIPTVPNYDPPAAVRAIRDAAISIGCVRDGAAAGEHAAAIQALQWIYGEVFDEWLRALARAQGGDSHAKTGGLENPSATRLGHDDLAALTGYKTKRNAALRVYQGRELLDADER